jgi:hypothetical protein
MVSSTTHPKWSLCPPSWIWFALIFSPTTWVNWSDFLKVPFDDQRRLSFNMVAMAAILDLVSVDYLTNACVDWSEFLLAHWGISIFTMFHFSLDLSIHPPPTDNFPLGGAYATPCVALVF